MRIEKELTKLYYTIGEVSKMFDVSNSLIRYWETEFPSLKPKKDKRGDRKFKVKDIRYIERIYTLVKERGFTLEGARKELKKSSNISKKEELKHKLKSTLTKLEKIRDNI